MSTLPFLKYKLAHDKNDWALFSYFEFVIVMIYLLIFIVLNNGSTLTYFSNILIKRETWRRVAADLLFQ